LDQDRADRLIEQIGGMIIADERYADRKWSAISVVAVLEDGASQVSGYSYDAQGRAEAGAPRNAELHDRFAELQAATQVEGQSPWKTCLVQIRREELKTRVDFEYEDAGRWKVTPKTLNIMPARLKPH
jgi:hypothetical protein